MRVLHLGQSGASVSRRDLASHSTPSRRSRNLVSNISCGRIDPAAAKYWSTIGGHGEQAPREVLRVSHDGSPLAIQCLRALYSTRRRTQGQTVDALRRPWASRARQRRNVQSSKMVHAALLLLMLEAVTTDLVSPSA